MGFEAAGLEEASGYVVGEVPEAECGTSEVFEAAVQCFGGSVRCAGPVEVGEDLGGALGQGSSEPGDLGEVVRDAASDALITACISCFPFAGSGCRYAAIMFW